jgi:hypothetical protein
MLNDHTWLVLAKGPGNQPVAILWTAKPSWFSSRPDKKRNTLTFGEPDLISLPSTRWFRQV